MKSLVQPHLRELIPYIPGKPVEETEREYGVQDIAKLASNENCLGPSPAAQKAIQEAMAQNNLYPDAGAFYLKNALCEHHAKQGVTAEHLVVGNGTNEILSLLVRGFVGPGEAILIGWPSFIVYRLAARACHREEVAVPLTSDFKYDMVAMADAVLSHADKVKLVFLANPNNPTGQHISRDELDTFLARTPEDVIVVLDEAYAEYVDVDDYPDGPSLVMNRPRTIVTRTFSKAYGLAALRVGYAICDTEIADILNRMRDPFNVGSLGQVAAIAALKDLDHVQKSAKHNSAERPKLATALESLGFDTTDSQANFVLVQATANMPSITSIYESLLKKAVIIRPVESYDIEGGARITVGTEEENRRLIDALSEILST
jgi:histidinol-phosphate aminotransferase